MQIFGKYKTNFDMDYLVEHYIYFPEAEEQITVDDLENMLKKKRKHVVGTIFLQNPQTSPKGMKMCKFLQEEGFDKYGEFVELSDNSVSHVINAGLKKIYPGKLVEIRYLFNYNREALHDTTIELFEKDLDKLNSMQLTHFDRELNYIDFSDIRLSGKFVFFGMGHKYERSHKMVPFYAISLVEHVQKLDKQIVFIYDKNYDEAEALKIAYFISPSMGGKLKESVLAAFKEVFAEIPPKIVRLS
ncbi:MAG: hypothetical protein IE887_02180 [Campylobacterales bacterium]|nr:hypothetical protein [Campylobacterales bacterium]